ncbi:MULTISPECIES: zinc-binding dehydrogenase [Lysinibacillus]|nr:MULTISPECIES: zinc-binding dehydrogenase [Lysinibacillus]KOS62872.1 sorbitol dehydrogenase [Lysinibacillus sp. FJAT-14222]
MKTLIVNAESELFLKEVPMPTITTKQALVKTLACGICGTDATIIKGGFKGFKASSYPIMLGHEAVGRVEKIGAEVVSYKEGDIVILPFAPTVHLDDGTIVTSGWGAFSEFGVIDDQQAHGDDECSEVAYAQQVLPANLLIEEAPILVTLREVYSTIQYFDIKKGATVLVYGSGPVALAFIKLMQLSGIESIAVVVRNGAKEELMRKFGVATIINTENGTVKEQIQKIYPNGVEYVLDAVGNERILNEGLTLLKDRGELLCYGVPKGNQLYLDYEEAPGNWKINFQQMPYKNEEGACHEKVLQWIDEGRLVLRDFLSDVYSFENIMQALEDYLSGKTERKVVIVYG